MTCAGGLNISVSGELLGSVKEVYEGKKTAGQDFRFNSVGQFLDLMPEKDRLEAYRLYISCIEKRRSEDEGAERNKIIPTAAFLSHAQELNNQLYIHWDEISVHTLFLLTTISFNENRFNNPAYLSSFDTVEAALKRPDQVGEWENIEASGMILGDYSGRFEAITTIEFNSKPQPGSQLRINFGPISLEDTITEFNLSWMETRFDPEWSGDKYIPWSVAYAKVEIVIERPFWLILSDAELLGGDDNTLLLRTILENYTDQTLNLRYLELSASHPAISTSTCADRDPLQTIELRWEKIILGEQQGIGTALHAVDVGAAAEYSYLGDCSNFFFYAVVPIDEAVDAHTSKQVMFKLKEMPPEAQAGFGDYETLFELLDRNGLPFSLRDWNTLLVGVDAGQGVTIRPRSREVRTGK